MIPLGLRSHNPGNIEFGSYARSMGSTRAGDGGRFAYFETMGEGIHALANLLIIYQDKHSINTVRGAISRWAPGNENNTEAYIAMCCHLMDVDDTDHLNFHDESSLWWLTFAIGSHENGPQAFEQYVSDADITAGVQAALA